MSSLFSILSRGWILDLFLSKKPNEGLGSATLVLVED